MKSLALVGLTLIAVHALAGTAQAATVTLPGGGTATLNPVGAGATGSVTGTQGGTATPFSCAYDVVQGVVTGSPSCSQILGGPGGLSLPQLEGAIVNARVTTLVNLQADTHLQLLDNLIDRRVDLDVVLQAQADMQSGASQKSSAFGDPSFGTWAYAGSGFFSDDRLGLSNSGHDVVVTAALDHRGGNLLVGGLVGYENTDTDLKSLAGSQTSNGYIVGAYSTYVLGPVFSLTASGTYSHSGIDGQRTFEDTQVTSHFGHDEWSVGVTGSGFWRLNSALGLTLLAGVDHDGWHDDSYVDSRGIVYGGVGFDSTWGRLGTVLTLLNWGSVRPFVNATYGHLLSDLVYENDRDTLSLGGGLALVGNRMSGALSVNTVLLQTGQNDTTISLSLHFSI